MGKKAGTKSPATKLDKAIAQARSEVERRQKQLADASRALAQLESRRAASEAVVAATAAKPVGAKKPAGAKPPVAAKPAVKKVATRKPAVARPTGASSRTSRTARPAARPSKTP